MDRDGGGAMDAASCVLAGHVDAMRQGTGGAAYKRIAVAASRWARRRAWKRNDRTEYYDVEPVLNIAIIFYLISWITLWN